MVRLPIMRESPLHAATCTREQGQIPALSIASSQKVVAKPARSLQQHLCRMSRCVDPECRSPAEVVVDGFRNCHATDSLIGVSWIYDRMTALLLLLQVLLPKLQWVCTHIATEDIAIHKLEEGLC